MPTVTREDDHEHNHSLDDSFEVKKPVVLKEIRKAEKDKGYGPAPVFHAVRGAGTIEGADRLETIGGSSLTR